MDIGSCHIGTADPKLLDNIIGAGLDDHITKTGAPVYRPSPYCLSVTDDAGNVIGGLSGELLWGWLFISLLWVDEKARGRGLGRQLVTQAENDLRQQGGSGLYLWTQDWEAPGFYEKIGFQRFVTLPDFPQGYQRIGLLKRIFGQGAEVIRP